MDSAATGLIWAECLREGVVLELTTSPTWDRRRAPDGDRTWLWPGSPVEIRLSEGDLREGDMLVITYGDTSSGDDRHWGWESPTCQVRGQFLGHWLSAAARIVATTGDPAAAFSSSARKPSAASPKPRASWSPRSPPASGPASRSPSARSSATAAGTPSSTSPPS